MQEYIFTVQLSTNEGETVCVVGNCPELGNWQPKNAVRMIKLSQNIEGEVWQVAVALEDPISVQYRYFVCVILENNSEYFHPEVVIRRWETHLHPRMWRQSDLNPMEIFGYIEDQWKVENGWLTAESVVQLKFYNNPIQMWKRRYKDNKFYIKVTAVDLERRESIMMEEESTEDDNHEGFSNGVVWPLVEIAVMNADECYFKTQEQFGRVYFPDDFIIFNAQMLRPETIAYMIDFYLYDTLALPTDVPKHIGFCYILPSVLHNTIGSSLIPISGNKHQPIGQISVEYLVVRPMALDGDMRVSYAKYWRRGRRTLEVGHRGSGNSYTLCPKHCATIRENTIASLKLAADHGADYVEFDVQLSKDLVPVIYHDFHVCITMKKKRCLKDDLLEIPVKDLTLSQLHLLKLYHVSEKQNVGAENGMIVDQNGEEENQDMEPFPTLELALQELPVDVGFNIEIKWTMQRKDGTFELDNPMELNQYLDILLKTLLTYAGERRIVISCFHPDICTMIRLKQSKYPILFLTQGKTSKWPPYLDTRTCSIPMAIYFAKSAGILGINVHTEEILHEHSLVKLTKDSNLVIFCWGDDNNDPNVIGLLRNLGLDGIIYDRINEKMNQENIYTMEKKSQNIILNAAGIQPSFLSTESSHSSDSHQQSLNSDHAVRFSHSLPEIHS